MGYEDSLRALRGRPEERHTVLPWSLAGIDMLPSAEGGVYALWCEPLEKCVYVGRTRRNLRTRVKEHWGLSTNRTLGRWITAFGDTLILCYHRCEDPKQRE